LFSRSRITVGDRFHAYDVLSESMGGRNKVTLAFWGIGLFLAMTAILLSRLPLWAGVGGALAGAVVCAATALAITRVVRDVSRADR
jgi:hypothetical protein